MFFIIPEYKIEQRSYINNGAWAASCYPRRQIHARCDLDKNILKQAVDERYLLFFSFDDSRLSSGLDSENWNPKEGNYEFHFIDVRKKHC